MRREERVRVQLEAVEFLRALKQTSSYQELSQLFGLSPVVLNRYIKGRVLPSPERAEEILELRREDLLREQVRRLLRYDADRFVDNSQVVFNTLLLRVISRAVAPRFHHAEKVLTAAVDGIPLAVHLAAELGVDCVFAKREREIGVDSFLETHFKLESGRTLSYVLPKLALRPGERVLIVDDLIRSGETQQILIDLAGRAKAEVIGIFALISVGEEGLRAVRAATRAPIEVLLRL